MKTTLTHLWLTSCTKVGKPTNFTSSTVSSNGRLHNCVFGVRMMARILSVKLKTRIETLASGKVIKNGMKWNGMKLIFT